MSTVPTRPPDGPTFTVVICTYNRASLLPRAVDSVLGQGFAGFELVVVDDGSVDDTAEVVGAYTDPRVRYVHQDNQGRSAARNAGVAASTGRYVGFLDDDDFALDGWLEHLSGLLDEGDPAIVCCGETEADDEGTIKASYLPGPLGPVFSDFGGMFLAGTYFVRRDVYDAVGGFRYGLHHFEHTELALRLLQECRSRGETVSSVEEALVQTHAGGPRRTGRATTESLLTSMEILLRDHEDQLAKSSWILAQYQAVAGVAAARTGDYPNARRHLVRAVRVRPKEWKHWARLGLALVPPVGRRVWDRLGTAAPAF